METIFNEKTTALDLALAQGIQTAVRNGTDLHVRRIHLATATSAVETQTKLKLMPTETHSKLGSQIFQVVGQV